MRRRPYLDRKTPLRRTSGLDRGRPINPVNRERRDREWERVYGSEERVWWVQRQPCIVCGKAPCDNAHVQAGGMGMKADARWIVPVCRTHHRQLHDSGRETFESYYRVDLVKEAERVEREWQRRVV